MRIYWRYLKSERVSASLYALALFACGYVMVAVFPSIAKIQMAQEYIDALPPFMKAFIGQEIMDITTLEGFLTVEFFNTTWLLIMGVFSCLFAGALVAEETERRTLEILLSTPVTRTRFVVSKFAGFLTLLVLLALASFLSLSLGMAQIGERVEARLMVYAFLTGTVCVATIGSIALWFSCLFNGQRRAVGVAIVVFILLYVFNVVAALLAQYPILGYLSLMNYYDAGEIFGQQGMSWPDMAILLGVISVMFAASIVTFRRKELYL
ncbi:ABC transporter permease subunit [Gemmatimonadota bacterium]